ncbi:MAG: hypothetical protein IGS48_10330 [Oscillatoriales cyanobacterium C42_A2020_001]|nr:hypothetical protein [Leptolyngbyaceae cyanobacterium C42_A2020_001]
MVSETGERLPQSGRHLRAWGFAGVVSLVFLGVAIAGILNHEMWSDELMFWMMARDNSTLPDLIRTLKFEYMHPFLWGILLHGISRFSRDPLAMQGLHILIATACVFLLCAFAPFPRWQKLLLTFSYFSLYEYSIISRNYGLGVLVMFLFCVLFRSRFASYIPLACLLALMANVNFYSRMTAIALLAMLVMEWVRDRSWREKFGRRRWDIALSLLIFATALGLSAWQNIPPNTGASTGIFTSGLRWQGVVAAIANLWKAYFPMPGLTLQFWNSNIIDDGYAAGLFWIPLGFSLALFYRRPLILFLYLFNLAEIVVFHSLWTGLMRHLGHVFILFVVCLWLGAEFPATPDAELPSRNPAWNFFKRYQTRFVAVVLVVQVIAGGYAYGMDLLHPFSQSKAVAQLVQRPDFKNYLVAGSIDVFTQSVSGHLDQPIFYPERDRLGTYISSDNTAQRLTTEQLLTRVTQATPSDSALLVLTRPLETPLPTFPNWGIQPLPPLPRAIVRVENYHLYRLQRLN